MIYFEPLGEVQDWAKEEIDELVPGEGVPLKEIKEIDEEMEDQEKKPLDEKDTVKFE